MRRIEDMNTRRCSKCKTIKAIDEFGYEGRKRKDGTKSRTRCCKACKGKKISEYYKLNPDKKKAISKKYYKENKKQISGNEKRRCLEQRFSYSVSKLNSGCRQKGIRELNATPLQIEAAFTGKCYICGVPEQELNRRLHIDHDHETGDFRGWLCGKCNTAIGSLNHSPILLRNAILYIESHIEEGLKIW